MINTDTAQIIDRFRKFVYERDLTLKQIALILKISHSQVSYILNGIAKNPHPRTLYKIKKMMGEINEFSVVQKSGS